MADNNKIIKSSFSPDFYESAKELREQGDIDDLKYLATVGLWKMSIDKIKINEGIDNKQPELIPTPISELAVEDWSADGQRIKYWQISKYSREGEIHQTIWLDDSSEIKIIESYGKSPIIFTKGSIVGFDVKDGFVQVGKVNQLHDRTIQENDIVISTLEVLNAILSSQVTVGEVAGQVVDLLNQGSPGFFKVNIKNVWLAHEHFSFWISAENSTLEQFQLRFNSDYTEIVIDFIEPYRGYTIPIGQRFVEELNVIGKTIKYSHDKLSLIASDFEKAGFVRSRNFNSDASPKSLALGFSEIGVRLTLDNVFIVCYISIDSKDVISINAASYYKNAWFKNAKFKKGTGSNELINYIVSSIENSKVAKLPIPDGKARGNTEDIANAASIELEPGTDFWWDPLNSSKLKSHPIPAARAVGSSAIQRYIADGWIVSSTPKQLKNGTIELVRFSTELEPYSYTVTIIATSALKKLRGTPASSGLPKNIVMPSNVMSIVEPDKWLEAALAWYYETYDTKSDWLYKKKKPKGVTEMIHILPYSDFGS